MRRKKRKKSADAPARTAPSRVLFRLIHEAFPRARHVGLDAPASQRREVLVPEEALQRYPFPVAGASSLVYGVCSGGSVWVRWGALSSSPRVPVARQTWRCSGGPSPFSSGSLLDPLHHANGKNGMKRFEDD